MQSMLEYIMQNQHAGKKHIQIVETAEAKRGLTLRVV